jgi:uncharacterized protein (TIGR03382 family)
MTDRIRWACALAAALGALGGAPAAHADGKRETEAGTAVARASAMFTTRAAAGAHGCSAAILDEAHAITAAHCTFGLEEVADPILVFATRVTADAPTRPIVAWFTPTDGFDEDLAVVEFEGGLPEGAAPVAIAPRLRLRRGDPLTIAGYGETPDGTGRGTLRQSAGRFDRLIHDPPRRYRGSGGVICSGDSGGPDFVVVGGTLRLLGVHVTGDCATTSVSTDVRRYVDFIASTGATPMIDATSTRVDRPDLPADGLDEAGDEDAADDDGGCAAAPRGGPAGALFALAALALVRRRR